jgi:hypothetical protein
MKFSFNEWVIILEALRLYHDVKANTQAEFVDQNLVESIESIIWDIESATI